MQPERPKVAVRNLMKEYRIKRHGRTNTCAL